MKKIYDPILVILIIFILIFAYLIYNDPYNRAKRDIDFLGNESADVLVIEFADYIDPLSAASEKNMVQLRSNYSSEIKFIYVHYPSTNNSRMAAMAAECAGSQKKFEKMHTKLFENYRNITEKNIYQWAEDLNIREDEFKLCMEKNVFDKIIDRDYDISSDLKASRLPIVFINKNRVEGLQKYSVYKDLLDSELGKA